MKRIVISVLFLIAVCLPGMAGATVYDLNNDWSDASNPNGVWSYNLNGSPLPSYIRGGDPWSTPQISWVDTPGGYVGWFKSNGTEQFSHDWAAGDIITHTPGSGYTDITWTSPITGQVSISGGVWSTRDSGRTNDWQLLDNTGMLASGTVNYGSHPKANPDTFALSSISVVSGDVLQLRLFKDSNSTQDYAGVYMTVDSDSTAVPEPASMLLLAFGLLGIGGVTRKFKK